MLIDNLERLSYSSVDTWRTNPAVWVCRYLLKIDEGPKPAAWRGSSVEDGLNVWFADQDEAHAIETMYKSYDTRVGKIVTEESLTVRNDLQGFLEQAIAAGGTLASDYIKMDLDTQTEVKLNLDGVPLPILGYVDYKLPGRIIDLKTTKACPSKPRFNHIMQLGVYNKAFGGNEMCDILYVTPKKHAMLPVDSFEMKKGLQEFTRAAKSLCRMLTKFDNPKELLAHLPPMQDQFYWSKQMWAEVEELWD